MAEGPVIPKSLKDALRGRQVVPFVGAGVSVPVKKKTGERLFPDWKGLLLRGADRLDEEGKKGFGTIVRALMDVPEPDYLYAAETLRQHLGSAWAPFLKDVFEVSYDEIDPSGLELTRAVWTLGSRLLITTNYDDVLRWACPPEKSPDLNFWDIQATAEQADWIRNGTTKKPTIWHLHGRIGNTADLILAPSGYKRLYSGDAESRYRAALTTLRSQLASKSFLFIGFSHDDQHFGAELRAVLETFEGFAGPHFVLAHRDEASRIRERCPDAVEVIEFENFDRLPDLIRSLGSLVETTTSTATDPPTVEPVGLLDVWLDYVIRSHDRLQDHFGPDQRPRGLDRIEEAWVEVVLEPGAHGRMEREAADGKALPGRALTLDEAVRLGCELSELPGNWLLEGPPGSGKTTMLRRYARRLAESRDPDRVPVFVSLSRLFATEGWTDLFEFLAVAYRLPDASALCGELKDAGAAGRLVILLDGRDEVPAELREQVDELLDSFAADCPGCPVILSSRPLGRGRLRSDYPRLELQPLPRETQRAFLKKWFKHAEDPNPEGQAHKALAHFHGSRGLKALADNPLYLTLLAVLWLHAPKMPEKPADLYDQVLDLLLRGLHKPRPGPIPAAKKVRRALGALAYGMTEADHMAESAEDLEDRLRHDDLEKLRLSLEKVDPWKKDLFHFLNEVYERTHILGPHDGRDQEWRFWHRTFREALTAEELRRAHGDDVESLARWAADLTDDRGQGDGERRGEGRWAEPLALLAGRLPKPDDLVKSLAEVKPELALRSMVFIQNLEAETLVHTLGLADKLDKRAEVFEQIPDQLGDPEACLAVVERLKDAMDLEKSYGFDFFWLGWILDRVSATWPGYSRATEQARRRLFDRIPPPDPEMFRHVQTRDGRVNLWCEIPAGEGWIGSPDDEEDRQSREGPRHRITIERPFSMGAVPVTRRQYAAFDPHQKGSTKPNHPAKEVGRYESAAFCRWLSLAFPGARLPTEEEWEYACRAGTITRFWNGNSEEALAEVGWYDENSGGRSHAVGEKPANPWGLYDVHGNVWEWTSTRWTGEDYSKQKDRLTVNSDDLIEPRAKRVIRGGSCAVSADGARSACRGWSVPRDRWGIRGFRVLVSRPPAPGL